MKRYPFWSYLNITAIDAPLISVAWYLYFVQKSPESSIHLPNCLILGSSVWLGYMADRLFDIRLKKEAQFIALRHRFCQEFETLLWILWSIILITTAIFSLITLNNDKIVVGLILVLFILVYNCLNQYFCQKEFPKEILVAALFAYGTQFLLEGPVKFIELSHFGLICFLNCLIMTHKDKYVDTLMGVNSWTHSFSPQTISIILVLSSSYYLIALQGVLNPYFATCFVCIILHLLSQNLDEEVFRVTTESLYAIIPLVALIDL